MEVAILYVVMMFDTWCKIFTAIAIISIVVAIVAGFVYLVLPHSPENKFEGIVMRRRYKAAKFSFYTFAGTLVFLFIIPTTKQGMVLVASGAVIEAAKTETAQRIAGKSVLVVEKALDELLADKPKEKK
jgi:membrane-anchored protein YejM (alkaline phosphatase superfamily)